MIGRSARGQRHRRERHAQREHRLDAFARDQRVARGSKADGMAEHRAHCPARGFERGLRRAIARKPGAMDRSDRTRVVSDRGEQRGPLIARSVVAVPVPAVRKITQRREVPGTAQASRHEIRLGESASQWPAALEQAPCPDRRGSPFALTWRCRFGRWRRKGEKASGLVEHFAKAAQRPVCGDEVEQVAMFAGGCIDPFACGAACRGARLQSHVEASPRRTGDVADHPVTPLAATLGQIVATNLLGARAQPLGDVACLMGNTGHVRPPSGRRFVQSGNARRVCRRSTRHRRPEERTAAASKR